MHKRLLYLFHVTNGFYAEHKKALGLGDIVAADFKRLEELDIVFESHRDGISE